MPFDLAIPPFFWATAKIDIPGDYDKRITGEFKAKFRRLDAAEHELVMRWIGLGRVTAPAPADVPAPEKLIDPVTQEPMPPVSDRAILDRVLLDWDELSLQGQTLTFTPDNLDTAEAVLGVRAAMVVAFLQHGSKAAEGNSGALPATSSAK